MTVRVRDRQSSFAKRPRTHLFALRCAMEALAVGIAGAALGSAPVRIAAAGATTSPPPPPTVLGHSYSLMTSTGALLGFGAAVSATPPTPAASAVVGVAPTPDGMGAWAAEAQGGIISLGDAISYGSMAGRSLAEPVVGIAAGPTGHGYWEVASDGGIFAFGSAHFYGSMGGKPLVRPIVGIAGAPTGRGYWEVASDGGIFAFGSAHFYGSMGGKPLVRPVVGMAAAPTCGGYWLVASDGGIFSLGSAHFYGSMGGKPLVRPVVGMAAAPTGGGYWLVASDGGIFSFGKAPFYGSGAQLGRTMVGIAVEAGGYQDPFRAVSNLVPERVDQGVDYAGSGPLYAIGDGVVLNTTNSGWPGGAFISYQLDDGPATGDIVYVAENVIPRVKIGQEVSASTVLGTLVDAYPDLEIGWAAPPGNGLTEARSYGEWSTYDDQHSLPSAFGENFSQLLASIGAPPGVNFGAVQGTLPLGWPTW